MGRHLKKETEIAKVVAGIHHINNIPSSFLQSRKSLFSVAHSRPITFALVHRSKDPIGSEVTALVVVDIYKDKNDNNNI